MCRALKDQGYESDSTLVFRKKEFSAPLSPVEQKQAYLNLQAGGEAPIQGFRKPAPEKPKGMISFAFLFWLNINGFELTGFSSAKTNLTDNFH